MLRNNNQPVIKPMLETLELGETKQLNSEELSELLDQIEHQSGTYIIQALSLFDNKLDDKAIDRLIKFLTKFTNIVELNLGHNKITDAGFKKIVNFIITHCRQRYSHFNLIMTQNCLTDVALEHLINNRENILHCTITLSRTNLTANNFTTRFDSTLWGQYSQMPCFDPCIDNDYAPNISARHFSEKATPIKHHDITPPSCRKLKF